jgi:hypothetical protein
MSSKLWVSFAVLIAGTATVLYLLGFRWYDHDVTAIGALGIIAVMGALIVRERNGRWK